MNTRERLIKETESLLVAAEQLEQAAHDLAHMARVARERLKDGLPAGDIPYGTGTVQECSATAIRRTARVDALLMALYHEETVDDGEADPGT